MRWRAFLVAAILMLAGACEQVAPARLGHLAAFAVPSTPSASPRPVAVRLPSPSPTPAPPAQPKGGGGGLPQTDCTRVVFHSFTAQPQAVGEVLVSWSTSGACTPVSGWIAGTYGMTGGFAHWTDYIHVGTGAFTDKVPQLPPGTNRIYCQVDVIYTLSIGGSNKLPMTTAKGVYIC